MKKNYLILFLSLLGNYAQQGLYTVDNWSKQYEGIQTNEPATKYLINYRL